MAAFLPLTFPLSANGGDDYQLLELDGYKLKWGEPELGAGASVSYAFADESLEFEEARNCRDLTPIQALSKQGVPSEKLERETAAAFDIWERAAGLSFHRVREARDADIVIGAKGQPRGRAFANVSYSSEPQDGAGRVRAIEQAQVCLNPEREWKVGFDGDKDVYDIRYTLIHEIGHAIGLDHPGPSGQVMGFQYTEEFAELQPGDLQGVRRLYGHGDDAPASDFDVQVAEKASDSFHAKELIGNSAVNRSSDEEVGSISNFIIDEDGSILAVVIGDFLGIGQNKISLAWDSVELVRDGDKGEAMIRFNPEEHSRDHDPDYEDAG